MRLSIFILLILSTDVSAQAFLNFHNLPGGYTIQQIRQRNTLKIDSSDNIWLAFEKIGAGKYDGSSWTIYDSLNSGLPSNTVYDIAFDGTGNTWFATRTGLAKFDGNNWTVYNTQNSGLSTDTIKYLYADGNEIWMGTLHGVIHFNGTIFNTFNISNSGIASDTVRQIIKSSSGDTYITTTQGLSVYNGSSWFTYNTTNSIISTNNLFTLQTDGMNRIWFGSFNILYFLENGIVKNFIGDLYTDLLPVSPQVQYALGKTNTGSVYFFSSTDALVVVDNNTVQFYYFSPSNYVSGNGYSGCTNQGTIWQIPRISNDTSALAEIDRDNYILPSFLSPTVHNSKTLNINNVCALMLNRGDMFWDLDLPAYEVPKGSGKHASYANALWIGGLDQGGNLHTAVQNYRQTGDDYWPGPIDGISQPFDSSSCAYYDEMYSVYKWKVEEFKTNFLNGSVSNGTYQIDYNMLKWPAKGNNGITDDKAPFVDYNNDNLYNPFDGDYPLIKGDQMIFWMFNDSLSEHSVPTDPDLKMGVEVHASAYAYSCPGIADSNQVINTTTLYHYRIINRSSTDYDSVFIGLWHSGSLGNIIDDFMGCDSTLATAYLYNGDNDDDFNVSYPGYGLNPPMQNMVILKGMLADPGDAIDNDLDGIVDESGERTVMNYFMSADGPPGSPSSDPATQIDYYSYMQSIWLDGLHLTYGGNGRDASAPPTNFMFSGTPYGSGWTEFSAGNAPEERTYVASSGPVSLPSGGELEIDFALVFTRDTTGPNGLTTSIARNTADIQRVKSWFDNDNFPGCLVYTTGHDESEQATFKLYPNPASDELFIDSPWLYDNAEIQISDVDGKILVSGKYKTGTVVNVSRFENGVYLIRVITARKSFTGRFVKMN